MRQCVVYILLLFVAVIAVAPASADRVALYSPDWIGIQGTPVKQFEWIAQPFHVPFDAYADYFGIMVGKASDSPNGMFVRLAEDDGIDHGTNPPTWPGAQIAEWGNIHPPSAVHYWFDFVTEPVLLRAGLRYWAIIGTYDSEFVGQIAYSGGDFWAFRSYDQAESWQMTGFRFGVRVAGYPVPEPASGAALLTLILLPLGRCLVRKARFTG